MANVLGRIILDRSVHPFYLYDAFNKARDRNGVLNRGGEQ